MRNLEIATLYVGGITTSTSIQDIRNFFYRFDSFIKSVKVFPRYAFVQISAMQADRAILKLNNKKLLGHTVAVERTMGLSTRHMHSLDSRSPYSRHSRCSSFSDKPSWIYRLKVSNLADSVNWRVLKEFMQINVGGVVYADSQRYYSNNGVVHFSQEKYMILALRTIDGYILHNHRIKLHSPKRILNKYALNFSENNDRSHDCDYRQINMSPEDGHKYKKFGNRWTTSPREDFRYSREERIYSRTKTTVSKSRYPSEVHYPPKDDQESYNSYYRSRSRSRSLSRKTPGRCSRRSLDRMHRNFSATEDRTKGHSTLIAEDEIDDLYDSYLQTSSYNRPNVKSVAVVNKPGSRNWRVRSRSSTPPINSRILSYTPPNDSATESYTPPRRYCRTPSYSPPRNCRVASYTPPGSPRMTSYTPPRESATVLHTGSAPYSSPRIRTVQANSPKLKHITSSHSPPKDPRIKHTPLQNVKTSPKTPPNTPRTPPYIPPKELSTSASTAAKSPKKRKSSSNLEQASKKSKRDISYDCNEDDK